MLLSVYIPLDISLCNALTWVQNSVRASVRSSSNHAVHTERINIEDTSSVMEHTVEELVQKHRRQYKASTVWSLVGMAWAACGFGYASSIIGTTLGE